MKKIILGTIIGLTAGLGLCACSSAISTLKSEPMTIVLTERNFVNTTKVTTEEGTYRIFTIESTKSGSGSVGIAAVKIK